MPPSPLRPLLSSRGDGTDPARASAPEVATPPSRAATVAFRPGAMPPRRTAPAPGSGMPPTALRTLSRSEEVIPIQVGNTPIPKGNTPIRMGASQPGMRTQYLQRRGSHPGMGTVPIRMGAFPTRMATSPSRMATVAICMGASPSGMRRLPVWNGSSRSGWEPLPAGWGCLTFRWECCPSGS